MKRFFMQLNSVLTIKSLLYRPIKKYCSQVLQSFSTRSIAIPHAIPNMQPVLQYLLQC